MGGCEPQNIHSGVIRGNPDRGVQFQGWNDIEHSTSYSPYFGLHVKSIQERSNLAPLLIIDSRDGVGMSIKTEIKTSSKIVEIRWSIVESEDKSFMAQGRAYWFATFDQSCRLIVYPPAPIS